MQRIKRATVIAIFACTASLHAEAQEKGEKIEPSVFKVALAEAIRPLVDPALPQPMVDPWTWFTANDYPADARRDKKEGRVRADLNISKYGHVTGCRVIESSGFADLDEATCRIAKERGKFVSGHDLNGRAIVSKYALSVNWALPHN